MPTRPLDLPARVGRYVLGPVLGVGGFAVVARARDESLDADVAVKILTARYALDPEIRERFIREARLLRRVRNPSVVTVHDVGETSDGRPYLVMDVAEGGVLQDRLDAAAGPADPASLHAVVTTLADGLGALHGAGVIHRDIKPANLLVLRDGGPAAGLAGATTSLLAPGERLAIGDLGLAKDQRATGYGPTIVGGTPRFQAPEQLEVGARVDARTDVYAATGVVWVLVTASPPPTPDELPVSLLRLAATWRPVLEKGLAVEPAERFASMAEWSEAMLDAAGLAPDGGSSAGVTRTAPIGPAVRPTATFPYKGLAAFQPDDAPLFFGRDALVDQLVARLQQRSTLVVGGASGSGKSSLVRAGLLPALAGGALPGSSHWPVCLLTPGDRPLAALRGALADATTGEIPSAAALAADPERARSAVQATVVPATVVVAVDQFEELFTLCADLEERQAFLDVLSALTGGASPVARVVLAVRADFYGTCAAYPWLASAINQNSVLLGPMTSAQLRETIDGPARRVGLHLQEGLVDRVLHDAGNDAGALPLVAHALVETWLRREGNLLTVAGYEAAGGVAGAIGRTADQVWESLDGAEQRAARRLLLRLVHPGDGTPDTKRLLTWAEVGDDERTRTVLARFADSRLLTVDERGVQLAHEALLRGWQRLGSWVEESRDELRAGERIEDAAREWERQGRHPDLLYRGVPLAAALEWRAGHEGAAGEPAGAFLTASEEARDVAQRAVEDRAQRAARTRRRVLVTLSTLTALALVTSLVAGAALARSRRDARAARAASRLASEQLARSLAASAVDLRATNPYLATMLAAEAMARVHPSLPEARNALVLSRLALAGRRLVPYGDPLPVGDALAVAVSPAGDRAATGNRDGTLAVWELGRRQRVARLTGPTAGIQDLTFTADGRWLVAASVDRRLWRWPVGGPIPEAGTVLADPGSVVWSVAAAPTGNTVAATTGAGEVHLVDVAGGSALREPFRPGAGELLSAAFSPDGSTLLAGSGRGEVFAWSLPSGQPRFAPIAAHGSDVWEIAMRPPLGGGGDAGANGFITVSSDGTAKRWDLATGASIDGGPFDGGPFDAKEASDASVPRGVRGVTVGPDGDTLTLGGADGALYSWSLSGRRLVERAGPLHRDRVTAAARSDDGLSLLTLSDDRTVQIWTERPRPDPVVPLATLDAPPSSIAVDSGKLAVGAADGVVRLLDAATGQERLRLSGHDGAVTAAAFDGPSRLVTGDSGGTLRLWDLGSGRRAVERLQAHRGAIASLSLAGGGRSARMASGGADGRVRLWNPSTLTAVGRPLGPLPNAVTDVAIAPDNESLAASTERGGVGRWTAGGRPIGAVFPVTDDTVWAVALGGGERKLTLAAAGADEVLSLWSLVDGRPPRRIHDMASHGGGALDVALIDGATAVVSSGDGGVRLWDVASGAPIGTRLTAADSPIRHLATASDGAIWAARRDGTVVRIDVLVLSKACAESGASFDAQQRDRLMAGRRPTGCRSRR